jgi:hypothetical protein
MLRDYGGHELAHACLWQVLSLNGNCMTMHFTNNKISTYGAYVHIQIRIII